MYHIKANTSHGLTLSFIVFFLVLSSLFFFCFKSRVEVIRQLVTTAVVIHSHASMGEHVKSFVTMGLQTGEYFEYSCSLHQHCFANRWLFI